MLKYGLAHKNRRDRSAIASKAATNKWLNYKGIGQESRMVSITNIVDMLKVLGIKYETEYKFHPSRRWRFDYAVTTKMVAIEYEGIHAAKSRHTTVTGFSNDCEKYAEAAILGWKVIRITAIMIKDGRAIDLIERALR